MRKSSLWLVAMHGDLGVCPTNSFKPNALRYSAGYVAIEHISGTVSEGRGQRTSDIG